MPPPGKGCLRLHVRVDERVAGFLALGLAKASGRCVPVVTTSGTAVGNLLPAVMEAHHSGVPLLVVSADRPAALVGAGANQTTDQTVVLAGFLRHLARLSSTAPAASWPAQAARAVLAAEGVLSRHPGPAQLNVELSEPLVAGEGPIAAPATLPAVRTGSLGAPEPVALAGTPPHRRDLRGRERGHRSGRCARWPKAPGCRWWPSRPATPASARTPWPPDGCCWPVSWAPQVAAGDRLRPAEPLPSGHGAAVAARRRGRRRHRHPGLRRSGLARIAGRRRGERRAGARRTGWTPGGRRTLPGSPT